MNLRGAIAVLARSAGLLVLAFGLALVGVCALTPTKPLEGAGLHRDTGKGTTYLTYGNTSGRGADFYFIPLGNVIGIAAITFTAGCDLLWVGCRLRRSAST